MGWGLPVQQVGWDESRHPGRTATFLAHGQRFIAGRTAAFRAYGRRFIAGRTTAFRVYRRRFIAVTATPRPAVTADGSRGGTDSEPGRGPRVRVDECTGFYAQLGAGASAVITPLAAAAEAAKWGEGRTGHDPAGRRPAAACIRTVGGQASRAAPPCLEA